jgi:hypothetical protein
MSSSNTPATTAIHGLVDAVSPQPVLSAQIDAASIVAAVIPPRRKLSAEITRLRRRRAGSPATGRAAAMASHTHSLAPSTRKTNAGSGSSVSFT